MIHHFKTGREKKKRAEGQNQEIIRKLELELENKDLTLDFRYFSITSLALKG